MFEVTPLLLSASEHAKVRQPGRQYLNHGEEVLGRQLDVVDSYGARGLMAAEQFHDLALPPRPAQSFRADGELGKPTGFVHHDPVQPQGVWIECTLECPTPDRDQRAGKVVVVDVRTHVAFYRAAERPRDYVEEHSALVRIAGVEGALRDTRRRSDGLHGCAVVAVLQEDRDGGFAQLLMKLGGFRPRWPPAPPRYHTTKCTFRPT
jgi:hypothetical protein